MGVTKKSDRQDEIKGQKRYIDQPGQWVDTTPKAVKARRDKGMKSLKISMDKRLATKVSKAKKK